MRRYLWAIMIAVCMDAGSLEPIKLSPKSMKDGDYMGITIEDSKVLSFDKIEGFSFFGISDIHYDAKQKLLYALNDRGVLFTFDIQIKNHKIISLSPRKARILKDKKGQVLARSYRDSESMVLGDETIMIAFEYHPRVVEFDTHLKEIKTLKIPKHLSHIRYYQGKNSALEALTYDTHLGYIMASEYPLRGEKMGYHDIYTQKGKLCAIQRERFNAIVEMQMMPDGGLLLLQRMFRWQDMSMATTLSKVDIQHPKDGMCRVELLAWMSSKEG